MKKLTAQDWGRLIGCKVKVDDKIRELQGLYKNQDGVVEIIADGFVYRCDKRQCIPILRTFDQMTEEEKHRHSENEFIRIRMNEFWGKICEGEKTPEEASDYIDSIHVDQRGWIEAGLAIKEGEL